jgi:uncharacterized membrane protein
MKFRWIIKFREYEIPMIGIIIFLIVTVWSLGMILAPLTLPPNSVEDLTGTVGPIENANITGDMNPYARFYYQAGDVNCHTKVDRSFFINGNQMPFCSRDVAIFFGMVIGMGIVLFIRFPIKIWWIVGGLVPIGLDGGLQLITSYESNNLFRVLTGTLAGVVTMLALGYVIYDVSKDMQLKREIKKDSVEFSKEMEEPMENNDPILVPKEELKEPNQDIDKVENKKDTEI